MGVGEGPAGRRSRGGVTRARRHRLLWNGGTLSFVEAASCVGKATSVTSRACSSPFRSVRIHPELPQSSARCGGDAAPGSAQTPGGRVSGHRGLQARGLQVASPGMRSFLGVWGPVAPFSEQWDPRKLHQTRVWPPSLALSTHFRFEPRGGDSHREGSGPGGHPWPVSLLVRAPPAH